MSVKIVVDSASDIDKDEAEKLGVTLIPMIVTIGDTEYLDGVTLSHKEFFEKLVETDDFPVTSQINEYRFTEVFEELTSSSDDEILCITMSEKLSGTYHSALKAAEKMGDRIKVFDTNNVCIGERLLIEYALRLAAEGKNREEIIEKLNESRDKVQLLALLNTLKYLKKGGRISAVTAFTGEILNIKPVVSVVNGEIKLIGKAVGSKKGNNLIMKLIEKSGGIDFSMPYAVGYSGLSDALLTKYLSDSASIWEEHTDNIPKYLIGSTVGTHVGPGAIAVAFFGKN